MPASAPQRFPRLDSSAGIVLLFAALAALLVSNSSLSGLCSYLPSGPLLVSIGDLAVDKPPPP